MVKLNKIYTRTGDDGSTGLVDGSRRSKADARMHAIGEVDELNSYIGVAIVALGNDALTAQLARIQNDLFDLGADIATPGEDFTPGEMTLRIIAAQVTRLETEIDAMNIGMKPLNSFILPGGSALGTALHVARSVTRRAERTAITASREVSLNPLALAYLNRLSDWLFVASRYANDHGANDILWVPGGSR